MAAAPDFPRDVEGALALQRAMAPRVRLEGKPGRLRRIAAADVAYDAASKRCWGAVVITDLNGRVLQTAVAEAPTAFPYVPGLLSFREAPVLYDLLYPLRGRFDVLLVDGQGLAHPRRFGVASHLGVLLNKPTVGCAKSRLCGEEPVQLGRRRGARAPLVDRGARIGTVLRTRAGVKPVYVSVGHRARLPWAERLLLDLAPRYRLPEPQRLAHRTVSRAKAAARARKDPA